MVCWARIHNNNYKFNNLMSVTVCLTSCNRFDLLRRTLDSFFRFNTYWIDAFYVYEDSDKDFPYKSDYPFVRWMGGDGRVGQIEAIDRLYEKVESDYIFHCEDDWEFMRAGFIEASLEILSKEEKTLLVWLRGLRDTNGHPHKDGYMEVGYQGLWHGFTFNPSLRRLSDYELLKPFSSVTTFDIHSPYWSEVKIGAEYQLMGFRSAILPDRYVGHIGDGRHVGMYV